MALTDPVQIELIQSRLNCDIEEKGIVAVCRLPLPLAEQLLRRRRISLAVRRERSKTRRKKKTFILTDVPEVTTLEPR